MPKPPPDPAIDRKIMMLRQSGLAVRVIAERLGISRSKVNQRLAAAQKRPVQGYPVPVGSLRVMFARGHTAAQRAKGADCACVECKRAFRGTTARSVICSLSCVLAHAVSRQAPEPVEEAAEQKRRRKRLIPYAGAENHRLASV